MRWLGLILLISGIWLIVDGQAAGVALIFAAFGIWAIALALVVFRAQRSADEPVTPSDGRPRRQPIPERVRHEVWRRDQGRCVDCGSRERLEYDHIIPVSRGGSNTARNIELRCEACNRRKGARI
jgi:hypothetical protein